MGAYAYCGSCGRGINPSLKDRLKGNTTCEHCGTVRSWNIDRDEAMDEIVDRLETLEAKISKLEKGKK